MSRFPRKNHSEQILTTVKPQENLSWENSIEISLLSPSHLCRGQMPSQLFSNICVFNGAPQCESAQRTTFGYYLLVFWFCFYFLFIYPSDFLIWYLLTFRGLKVNSKGLQSITETQ